MLVHLQRQGHSGISLSQACRRDRKEEGEGARKISFEIIMIIMYASASGRLWELFLKDWKEFPPLISILSQRKSN